MFPGVTVTLYHQLGSLEQQDRTTLSCSSGGWKPGTEVLGGHAARLQAGRSPASPPASVGGWQPSARAAHSHLCLCHHAASPIALVFTGVFLFLRRHWSHWATACLHWPDLDSVTSAMTSRSQAFTGVRTSTPLFGTQFKP